MLSLPNDASTGRSQWGREVLQPACIEVALFLLENNLNNMHKDSSLLSGPARVKWLIYSLIKKQNAHHYQVPTQHSAGSNGKGMFTENLSPEWYFIQVHWNLIKSRI